MVLSSLSLLRVIKWFHLSGWIFSYSDQLMKSSSHVLAYENLCWSIRAERISFTSTACAWYLTILTLNFCNIVRSLIGCSMNYCTCPCAMFATFSIFVVHVESCSACCLTMSCKSKKSLGEPIFGRPMSFISRLILTQLLSQSAHFSWISRWGSWAIFT